MQFKIRESLPFIVKKDVKEGYVDYVNGAYVVRTDDGFKQVLKMSEYRALQAAMGNKASNVAEENVEETNEEEVEEVEPKAAIKPAHKTHKISSR